MRAKLPRCRKCRRRMAAGQRDRHLGCCPRCERCYQPITGDACPRCRPKEAQ